jgi:hypothetical protein
VPLTNRLAVILGLILLALLVLDLALGSGATLFLLRKLAELIEWIAFWR